MPCLDPPVPLSIEDEDTAYKLANKLNECIFYLHLDWWLVGVVLTCCNKEHKCRQDET